MSALAKVHDAVLERDPQTALILLAEQAFDLVIVSTSLEAADGLRLCSQVRSLDRTRHMPIVILVEAGNEARLLRGLDMGVNDYLMAPSTVTSCSPGSRRRSSASAIRTTSAIASARALSSRSPIR